MSENGFRISHAQRHTHTHTYYTLTLHSHENFFGASTCPTKSSQGTAMASKTTLSTEGMCRNPNRWEAD
jgi:hypothetical protein